MWHKYLATSQMKGSKAEWKVAVESDRLSLNPTLIFDLLKPFGQVILQFSDF